MKVTLTIETTNDKPIPEGIDIEEFEEKCKMAWQVTLNYICMLSDKKESAKAISAKIERG